MKKITIRDIQTIVTAPSGVPVIVVKVLTSEPELYGLGCATYTWRYTAVQNYINDYLKPLLIGREVSMIEDLWNMMNVNGYWRSGPVGNNAISGIDMALWDIKGKVANLPCYELWGGKSREYVSIYMHADGKDQFEVHEKAQALYDQGLRHIRCQLGGYQGTDFANSSVAESFKGEFYSVKEKISKIPQMFKYLREKMPDDVEFIYDVHERLDPMDAVNLAKRLEEFNLFYLEDMLPPEQLPWLENVRAQTSTKIAVGELFTDPSMYVNCVSKRLVDFIRVHPSFIGGITPSIKLAHLASFYDIKTAWHGPADLAAVGAMANLHLSVSMNNFGIQEWADRSEQEWDVFPGFVKPINGKIYLDPKPGLGIEIDEKEAAKYPCQPSATTWTEARLYDGTIRRP